MIGLEVTPLTALQWIIEIAKIKVGEQNFFLHWGDFY